MKLYILLLLFFGFLQTSFVPLNLILILIIAKALVSEDLSNYYMAFFGGIFLSVLSIYNLGFWPLILLIIVKLIYLSKKLPLSKNIITMIGITFLLIFGVDFLESKIFVQYFAVNRVVFETIVFVPVYYLLKFWEQRFIVKPEVKLKIRR